MFLIFIFVISFPPARSCVSEMAFLLVFISLLLGVLAFFHMIKHPGQKQGSSMSMRVRCSHAQRQAANLRPSLSGAVQHASERPDTISKAMEKGAIQSPPPLRIVIMVAGTRGDVQPAVALALRLMQDGHRVRVATHAVYAAFVKEAGVTDFFPLAGNPQALTQVAVEAGGMLPKSWAGFQCVRSEYAAIIHSTWEAVVTCPEKPSLIITTPITYGVPHVAEALGGIPLHVISAVPWMPSKQVPHPWARAWDLSVPQMIAAACDLVLPSASSAHRPAPHHSEQRQGSAHVPCQPIQPAPTACQPLTPPGLLPSELRTLTRDSLEHSPEESSFLAESPLSHDIPLVSSSAKVVSPSAATSRSTLPSMLEQPLQFYDRWRSRLRTTLFQWAAWASTPLLDHCVWLGIADILAVFRARVLGLRPFGGANHGWVLYKHPTIFTFSSLLLPACASKPSDWGEHVFITGPLLLDHVQQQQQQQQQQQGEKRQECPEVQQGCMAAEDEGIFSTNFGRGGSRNISTKHCDLSKGGMRSPSLESFLNAGPPPVYVSFGSACDMDVPFLMGTICRAALATKTRILLSRSMIRGAAVHSAVAQSLLRDAATAVTAAATAADSSPSDSMCLKLSDLSAYVLLVDELPHNLILPRCCAAIVHGGIGHVLSCLSNGCPLLVTPCYGDHFSWAEAVQEAGYGPPPIPATKLSQEKLESALIALRERPCYSAAASKAKHMLMAAPRGVDLAVAHIYRHLPPARSESEGQSTSTASPPTSLEQDFQDSSRFGNQSNSKACSSFSTVSMLRAAICLASRVLGLMSGCNNIRQGRNASSSSSSSSRGGGGTRGRCPKGLRWAPWPVGDGWVRM